MNAYVVFTDLKGFSKLTENQLTVYFVDVQKAIFTTLEKYNNKAKVLNTWGDAFFMVFENAQDAVNWMFDYRDCMKKMDFDGFGIPPLSPRIAGHFGQFEVIEDPILKRMNAVGHHINTAARIEPITKEGEIYVTDEFKNAIDGLLPGTTQDIKFEGLGEIPMAKNFGTTNIFRLRRAAEKEQIIDKLVRLDLQPALPEPVKISSAEIKNFENLEPLTSFDMFNALYPATLQGASSEYTFKMTKLLMKFGQYEKALELIEKIELASLAVDGLEIFPNRSNFEIQKTKANCLSRVNQYEAAANIIYQLWQSNQQPTETLSMLAAQYKRRALYGENKTIDPQNINKQLLERARDLYLEAFRLDISNYYPAINAAYLYKILEDESGSGIKLAHYIIDAFDDQPKDNWWLTSTLAEANILCEDFATANDIYKNNIDQLTPAPGVFDLESTVEQLYIYKNFANQDQQIQNVIDLLETYIRALKPE
ncbi:MAG: adenylate/guanylate cyclase domain-containing protein [Pseudomonadales bacterium]|nr:adenylate/guanylate cyclase domain-containing protein [Pseudomonadales bacterium]